MAPCQCSGRTQSRSRVECRTCERGKHNMSTSHTLPGYLYPIMQGNTVKAPQYAVHWRPSKRAFAHCPSEVAGCRRIFLFALTVMRTLWSIFLASLYIEDVSMLQHDIIRALAQPISFIKLISPPHAGGKHTPVCEASLTHALLSA